MKNSAYFPLKIRQYSDAVYNLRTYGFNMKKQCLVQAVDKEHVDQGLHLQPACLQTTSQFSCEAGLSLAQCC